MEFFYRFRPTNALLEGWSELEKQEIYFASLDQLNDPMEAFNDVFWSGDRIAWANLIKHYLLCLEHTILLAAISGADYDPETYAVPVFASAVNLPTPQFKDMHREICRSFFSDSDVGSVPDLLAARRRPIRRDELIFYIRGLHPRALECITRILQNKNLTHSSTIPPLPEQIAKAQAVTDILRLLEPGKESNGIIGHEFLTHAFTIAGHIQKQTEILMELRSNKPINQGWQMMMYTFPEQYVQRLDRLIYSDWYTACFVKEYNNAAMWGNYGDSHKGACLKFRATANAEGKFLPEAAPRRRMERRSVRNREYIQQS